MKLELLIVCLVFSFASFGQFVTIIELEPTRDTVISSLHQDQYSVIKEVSEQWIFSIQEIEQLKIPADEQTHLSCYEQITFYKYSLEVLEYSLIKNAGRFPLLKWYIQNDILPETT